ncbi:Similar to F6D8.5 [Arabidopsis thaliana]|uniref:F6D8.7 protein n=1 Tax=Arabidopsis thaliana TaxID=3702 RepID=Q9SSS2_ARATH|nr:Similar to F6D8.5 [Arabidopsis thaliana]
MASSSRNQSGRKVGETIYYSIPPTGVHKATIVWLHDVGFTGHCSVPALESLRHPNIKWIVPTAPMRPVTSIGGEVTTAWCDMTKPSENMLDDFENLNYTNSFITSLFSSEPDHVMKGVGGIGLGAAQALYYTSCYAFGWVPISPQIVIRINGWLPADDVIPSAFGYKCADSLRMAGFPTLFKQCGGSKQRLLYFVLI